MYTLYGQRLALLGLLFLGILLGIVFALVLFMLVILAVVFVTHFSTQKSNSLSTVGNMNGFVQL